MQNNVNLPANHRFISVVCLPNLHKLYILHKWLYNNNKKDPTC